MNESFKYVRLEISSVLFRSWGDFHTLLKRKNSGIEKKYFAFLYCGKITTRKGIIPSCIDRFRCSYFVYNDYDLWLFFNRYNKHSDKYQISLEMKIKFITRLKEINERFNYVADKKDIFQFSREEEPKTPFKRNTILQHSIPMLSLNAAIVEGTLREILARYIQNEINKYIEIGNQEGRYTHNNYQKMLVSKQINIESNSSIASLLTEYSIIFDLKTSEIMRKEIINILDSLFTLRNLLAHGTSIVTTNIPVEHDQYFKNWNKRVVKMQEVLKKYFGSDSIHENLSDYRMPEFYMSYSRIYLLKIANFVEKYDESGDAAVNSVNIIKTLREERGFNQPYNFHFLDLYNFPKK